MTQWHTEAGRAWRKAQEGRAQQEVEMLNEEVATMDLDKHQQRVVLDTIRRRIDSLNEIQVLLDAAADALERASVLSEAGSRPNIPEPLQSTLMELRMLSQAARLECLQVTQRQQRNYADQAVVVADHSCGNEGMSDFPGAHAVADANGNVFVLGSSAKGKTLI